MNCTFKKLTAVMLCLVMLFAVVAQTSCADTPAETTPEETTPVATPESTPESTPEATPESTPVETTPAPGEEYNISYDLDGGIVDGNPLVYNNATDTKIAIPVKVGYDFVGWTGTGIDTPTVSVTVAKGTEGDISLKANWVENGEFEFKLTADTEDTFGKIFFGKTKAAFIINGEASFENNPSINASNYLVAQKLQTYFEKQGRQIIKLIRDEDLPYSTNYDFKMYIGISDCEAVEEFMSTLNYAQYGIAVNEDSLCYIAWTEAANKENGKIFYEIIEHVVKGGSISDFAGGRYVGMVEGTVGEDVPVLDGLDSGTDVGEGAYQLYSLDSTKEIYDAYLAKLEAAGYTFHTSNVMGKTYAATYYNDDTVINVMFAGGDPDGRLGKNSDRSLRVIVEPKSNTALPATEKPADATATVTPTTVTQLYPTNLCIIFQLSNGHFIVLDSGNNGNQKAIVDFLRANAPDKNNVIVEAWIFSHFHQDHIGGFIDFMNSSSLKRYVNINSIIYNFPSERTYLTASGSSTDMNNVGLWYNKHLPELREKGTTIYQARTGQKYYFGNAEIDILWTFEDIQPFNIFDDTTNRTNIGFRVTVEGQTFMLTGDSSEEEFRVAAARYGDYLKSDFLQLAHHGSGNGNGVHDLYTYTAAPVIFHPRKQTLEDTHYGIGGNEKNILRKDTTKLVIRSGNYHTATLTLPFTVGDPIVSDRVPEDESHTYMN